MDAITTPAFSDSFQVSPPVFTIAVDCVVLGGGGGGGLDAGGGDSTVPGERAPGDGAGTEAKGGGGGVPGVGAPGGEGSPGWKGGTGGGWSRDAEGDGGGANGFRSELPGGGSGSFCPEAIGRFTIDSNKPRRRNIMRTWKPFSTICIPLALFIIPMIPILALMYQIRNNGCLA